MLGEGKNYTLMTKYKGELTDGLGGLYRSSYTDEDGNVKLEYCFFSQSFEIITIENCTD